MKKEKNIIEAKTTLQPSKDMGQYCHKCFNPLQLVNGNVPL